MTDRVKPTTVPPKIVLNTAPPLESADPLGLTARTERERERFSDADLSDTDLTGISFSECELSGLTLTRTQLRAARFSETRLIRSFAPEFLAARTTWREVGIESPRWGSAELFDAELNMVHVRGGKIDFLNLRNCRLTDVLIEDCLITELDLQGSRATRVAIRNCRIETLELGGARSTNVDLRSSEFQRINGLDGVRGTTIDDYQLMQFAPVLAAHLGLRVE